VSGDVRIAYFDGSGIGDGVLDRESLKDVSSPMYVHLCSPYRERAFHLS
jgi:hypothetical protein